MWSFFIYVYMFLKIMYLLYLLAIGIHTHIYICMFHIRTHSHTCISKINLETVLFKFSVPLLIFGLVWSFRFWVRPLKTSHSGGRLVNFPCGCHLLLYVLWGSVVRCLQVPDCSAFFFRLFFFSLCCATPYLY